MPLPHLHTFGLLGGSLSGILPNPSLSGGERIAAQIFGKRASIDIAAAAAGGMSSDILIASRVFGQRSFASAASAAIETSDALLVAQIFGRRIMGGSGTAADPSTVLGPATATDNAIARFDGTTGKLLQNSGTTLSDSDILATPNAAADEIGFKGIPQNSQTTNYTLVLADASKCIYKGSGGAITVTIPANSSVAFPVGTCIEGINDDTENLSIAITTDTLVLAPTGSTGTRTVAPKGWWAIRKVASTRWFITGAGVT